MKKKLVSALLMLTLAAGAAACGTADTGAEADVESSVQEKASGNEDTMEAETAEPEETEATESQEVNGYGLTEEEWNLLMEKYRGELTERVQSQLAWEASEQFDPSVETSIRDDASRYLEFGEVRLLGAYMNAGEDDMAEVIDNFLKQGEAADWMGGNWTIQDQVFLTALAEWKTEAGISQEKLTAFLTALLENLDSFSETYTKPILDELLQGA